MEPQRKEYNGWSTFETWAVGMFLDGNYTGEPTYREVQDITDKAGRDLKKLAEAEPGTTFVPGLDEALGQLAGQLEEYVRTELRNPESGRSLDGDLLVRALGEVNWREIAATQLEGIEISVPKALVPELGENPADAPTLLVNRALAGMYDGPGVVAEVQQRVRHAASQDAEYPAARAAEALKDYVDDELRQEVNGLAGDLIGATLSDVNWRGLAEPRLPENPRPASADQAPQCRPNLGPATDHDAGLER